MGRKNYSLVMLVGIFIGLFAGIAILSLTSQIGSEVSCSWGRGTVEAAASTNPSSPQYLYDDSADFEYYSSSYYYYRTNTYASSSYYHVIWLRATSSSDNFNLNLYSNSGYSSFVESSTRSYGYLDWVIFNPSSSYYYYPRVYRSSGTGDAYIEWEDGSTRIDVGQSSYYSLSSSECIEIYEVYLSSNKYYKFTLNVPSNGDFELYVYYLAAGSSTNTYGSQENSVTYGYGVDESITRFKPTNTGDHAILVVWTSGSGSFTLQVEEEVLFSAAVVIIAVLAIMGAVGISVAVYNKYRASPTPNTAGQPQTFETVRAATLPAGTIPAKKTKLKTISNKVPFFRDCPFCGSRNDFEVFFCKSCGTEL